MLETLAAHDEVDAVIGQSGCLCDGHDTARAPARLVNEGANEVAAGIDPRVVLGWADGIAPAEPAIAASDVGDRPTLVLRHEVEVTEVSGPGALAQARGGLIVCHCRLGYAGV